MKKITFVTNVAAFYKTRLYNYINKHADVDAFFLDAETGVRSNDFINHDIEFKYKQYSNESWIQKCVDVLHHIFKHKPDEVVVGGWDKIEYFIIALFSKRSRNCIVVESSYLESKSSGYKALIKRLFLSRISTAYVSGESNKKLLENLKFKGSIIKTYGVGIFNYRPQPVFVEKDVVSRFLYVGRLTAVKNLPFIIDYFNARPELTLTIVGGGELEKELKMIANDNITFAGIINNNEISDVYRSHDVFILPSLIEPWGLVVEEALNCGIPVIVSDKVGCAEEIIHNNENGYIFEFGNIKDLDQKIESILNIDNYNRISMNISKYDIEKTVEIQVEAYIK